MAGVTEKVLPHLEGMDPAAILNQVHEIEKYDRVAGRNYGLDGVPPSSGILSLNVLMNHAFVQINAQPQK